METKQELEVVAEFKSPQPSVVEVRGSLIVSSLATLRELNLQERYFSFLPRAQHDAVQFVLASSWVPVDLVMAHYAACDAMQLSDAQLEDIGRHVSERIMGTFLGTLMRSTRKAGAPSHVPIRQYPRLWERLFVGGSCAVLALGGPKDARIESRGVPMFRYRYFRTAYVAMMRGAGLVFRAAMHARVRKATDDSLTLDLSWV